MSDKPLLLVCTEHRNGVAMISLEGDIDIASVDRLDEELAVVEQNGTTGILLDFGLLTFIDSTGLHCIDRAHRRAQSAGRVLAVSNESRTIKRPFEVAGMDSLLNSPAAGNLLERFSSVEGNGSILLPAPGGDHA